MLTDLLWFWDAKRQYEHQKAQGLAGLLSILFVIFFVWEWEEWFYPLFKKIGLVGLAMKTGLVNDLSVVTIFNVLAIIFLLCVAYALIALVGVMLGVLCIFFAFSNLGQNILAICLLPITAPFIFLSAKNIQANMPILERDYRRDKELKGLLNKYSDLEKPHRDFKLYLEQLQRSDDSYRCFEEDIYLGQIEKYLNKVIPSLTDFNDWWFGYEKQANKMYLLFPNPLPGPISQSFEKVPNGRGLYGLNSSLSYPDVYCVPGLEIDIKWDGEKLKLFIDPSTPIKAVSQYQLITLYKVKSAETSAFFANLLEVRKDIVDTLKQTHLALYLLPYIFPEEKYFYYPDRGVKAIKESFSVTNREALQAIYAADVQSEIIKHAKNGEEWAINWFSKVD
jgi:hypothetical protein